MKPRRLHRRDIREAVFSAAAAAGCVVTRLARKLVSHCAAAWRYVRGPVLRDTPADLVALRASMRKRREVLDARLAIDEPHLCSQYLIVCTCWCFCESKARHSARDFASFKSEAMPVVYRSGMDSCPFRFAGHASPPVPVDGTAPAGANRQGLHDGSSLTRDLLVTGLPGAACTPSTVNIFPVYDRRGEAVAAGDGRKMCGEAP